MNKFQQNLLNLIEIFILNIKLNQNFMKTKYFLIILLLIFYACEKPERILKLKINNISNVTDSTALLSTTFVDLGSDQVLEWGLCWAENENPTLLDFKTSDNILETGNYEKVINNLKPSTTYFVRNYVVTNIDTFYFESSSFTSRVAFKVNSPDKNSTWETGKQYSITWTSHFSENVKIELFKNSEKISTISEEFSNLGEYQFIVPTNLEDNSDYQIKITNTVNPSEYVYSQLFTIFSGILIPKYIQITSPINTSIWKTNNSYEITWNSNAEGNVKILLFKNNLLTSTISNPTPNDGLFQFFVPTNFVAGLDYNLQVISIENNLVADTSENFEIRMTPKLEYMSKTLVSDKDINNYSDGFIGKNEDITLAIKLVNKNNYSAQNVTAIFTPLSTYITELSNLPITYNNIGYNQNVSKNITFHLNEDAPINQNFEIQVQMTDAENNVFLDTIKFQRVAVPEVTHIYLTAFPSQVSDIEGWDPILSNYPYPDIFFEMYDNTTLLLSSQTDLICEAVATNNIYWFFTTESWFPKLNINYTFKLWDDDSGTCTFGTSSANDFMGSVYYKLNSFVVLNNDESFTYSLANVTVGNISIFLKINWIN